MKADKATVKKAIQPAIKYLRQLNPYLWKQGKTFPSTSTKLDTMYQDGEVVMDMSYSPYSVTKGIADGLISKTNQTFVFDKGTIGNTSYMAIAFDSPNKAGAEVLINAILSPKMQLTQYKEVKNLPVTDMDKLSSSQKKQFESVDMGSGTLSQDTLLKHRVPEMPADLVPVIEKIWSEEVVGK
jgi:putative spermidine/putrescine transport system substrate-binding protein